MRYVFFGTPEFAVIVLQKLIDAGYAPSAIVTNPDKPMGRKKIITPPPVKQWVLHSGLKIKIFQPEKLKDIEKELHELNPDLFIVAAYGKIIPKSVLDIPKSGSLNVHPSLLPKHRGPTPIQTAILNGDEETGVSIILLDEEMDHGPILKISNFEFPINYNYTSLSGKLAELGAKLLVEVIPAWLDGRIEPVPQDDAKATYTRIYKGEDGLLDLNKSAEELDCKIRALNPEPGTYFIKNNKRIKVLEAHVEGGNLVFDVIQQEGKKPIPASNFNPNF